ncbi:MAG: hypothetical protein JWN79_2064, partial [Gemmatimonadetes bacterium]|nr:hypothetical protein [Gemmatimonadota bacterium]
MRLLRFAVPGLAALLCLSAPLAAQKVPPRTSRPAAPRPAAPTPAA